MKVLRGRGCVGKRRHDTEAGALAELWNMRRSYAAVRLNVYACKHCGGWHVGHRPRTRRKR